MTPPAIPGSEVSPLVIKGVAWNGTSRLVTRGVQFVVTLILARLLVPADFGLAGMASIVTMLGGMISEMGFGVAVVQKKELSERDISTAFWTSVILGVIITGICVITAPLAAAAFHSPEVTPIIAWSSLGLMIGSLAVTPQALLVRRVDFRSVAIAETASSAVYAATAIALAAAGWGVWSLVIAGLALGAVRTSLFVGLCRINPWTWIDRDSLRAILPFGLRMFGSNIVQFLRSNLDYFVVGSTLGPASLGLYTLAFKLADFPRLRLASTITEVALPRISAVQDEDDQVVIGYSRSLTGITMVTFPLLVGLASLAPEFITVAYGEQWHAAITPLQILLLMGIFQSISDAAMTAIVAKGRADKHLALSVVYLVSVAIFATAGVRWGLTGVAVGVSVATVIYLVTVHVTLRSLLGVRVAVTLKSIALPSAASALMAVALLLCRRFATQFDISAAIWLPAAVVIGATVFFATTLLAIGPDTARRVYRTLRTRETDGESPAVDAVGI